MRTPRLRAELRNARWLLRRNSPSTPVELDRAHAIHEDFPSFYGSPEFKVIEKARAAWIKRHPRPGLAPDQRGLDGDERVKAYEAWAEANKAWQEQADAARRPVEVRETRRWRRRVTSLPIEERRFGNTGYPPSQARNLARKLRVMAPVDGRQLDRLDRRIIALQMERSALIWAAWERAITLTVDDLPPLAAIKRPPVEARETRWWLDHHDRVEAPRQEAAA